MNKRNVTYSSFSELRIDWLPTQSIISKITTLSELFTEWFLYESDTQKTIETFIVENGLSEFLSGSDFSALICGRAYLSDALVALIRTILPFKISESKMSRLNMKAKKSDAHEILSKPEIAYNKAINIIKQQQKEQQERKRIRNKINHHKYYLANKEYLNALSRKYVAEHTEQVAAYQKQYRIQNHKKILAYESGYRRKNAKNISDTKKKCYYAKKEQYRAHQAEYYEQNRQAILKQQHEKRNMNKERDNIAKSVCPTYLYLLAMRHNNRTEYLKLFGQRNPVSFAIKKCPALQKMNSTKCAFCDGTEHPHTICAMQQMTTMPDGIIEAIPNFVAIIKNKSNER